MRTFQHCFVVATRLIAWPFIVAVVLVCFCLVMARGDESTTEVDNIAGLWLHLPAFLLSATCLGAALEAWPLYSRERAGHGLLLRLQKGPLSGCGAAALGTLAALAVSLLLGGAIFQAMLNSFDLAHKSVHARIRFTTDQPHLDERRPHVTLSTSEHLSIESLRLRPSGYVTSADIRPAQIRVLGDGKALHGGWLTLIGGELHIPLEPPRSIRELSIQRHPDSSLLLVFHRETVWGRSTQTYGELANCLLAVLSYLLPAALALAVMAVGHRHLGLPVGFGAGLATLSLSTLVDLTPNGAAVRAFARGRWLPTEGLSTAVAASLGAVGLILLLAYLVGKLERT
ncbi:MAG: hypothetical protein ACYTGW_07700 [Planctomycetota bacterium]|jgi:hypothetical protein